MSRRRSPSEPGAGRELARPEVERLATAATVLTFLRTAATLVLALWGAYDGSLGLLLWALGVYWVGDIADGALARWLDQETRIGAVLDIMCDRLSAASFYLGFAWYDPSMAVPVGIYLAEFLVLDMFISIAFLAWPVSSPNYFYVVDSRLWRWNWSKPGKALNSGLFAVLMVSTRQPWVAAAVALGLFGVKAVSLGWLMRLGLPVPAARQYADPVNPGGRNRVAIVSGYFNPLHVGHVRMMTAARALGDRLVVIVNNDDQQLAKLGVLVQPLDHRIEIVQALRCVDDVVASVDRDATVVESLRLVRAKYRTATLIFANGGDRSDPEAVAELDACRELSIEVVLGVGGRDKADASSRINRVLGHLAP